MYARFRDDIFVVIGGDARNRIDFGHAFKRHSSYFKLKIESISDNTAVMLDLQLSKGKRFRHSGLLGIAIHTKATSQGVPLCHTSWHQPSIHTSWPASRCIHYYRCCTSRDSYSHAVFKVIAKIASSDPDHHCLAGLSSNLLHRTLVRHGSGTRPSSCSRLILPYHPGLASLNGQFESLRSDFAIHGFEEFLPRVTWSLGAPNIARRILRDTRTKLASGRS